MSKCRMFLLLLIISQMLHANVAVDQLNTLLVKKESAQTTVQSPVIKNLAENYYFVFIYKGSCPHCHKFAPVLKDFAGTFHVEVQSYSMDNAPMDGFEGHPLPPELFQTFFVAGSYKPMVPALFLVNRHTLEAYAVLFGEASPYQLARRVNEMMQHIEEKFND